MPQNPSHTEYQVTPCIRLPVSFVFLLTGRNAHFFGTIDLQNFYPEHTFYTQEREEYGVACVCLPTVRWKDVLKNIPPIVQTSKIRLQNLRRMHA